MAKIWYSVQGDGLGHAIRSSAIIEELRKKHSLFVTGCNKSYPFLKKRFGPLVHEIEGNTFVYEDNEAKLAKSLQGLMLTLPEKTVKNLKHLYSMTKRFSPDLIISDFEQVSHYFAFFLGVPIISLDNINILSECRMMPVEKKYLPLYISFRNAIKLFHPGSDYYLITTIIDLKPDKKTVLLFPPVLRKEVLGKKPKKGDYILVYQTTATNKALLPVLKGIKKDFRIYGMDREGRDKNLSFKKFSETGFIEDLRSSQAVIVNGGFTAISEALYFKKPILAVPVKNQFEQMFNGMTLKKLGYGDWHEVLDKKGIEDFLKKIPKYDAKLEKLPQWDNKKLLAKVEELIKELAAKPKPALELSRKLQKVLSPKKIERTLTIIKPDAVEKKLIGEVIGRLEKQGIRPVAMKMRKLTRLETRFFYAHLKGKVPSKVFDSMMDYMTSNKVVLVVWQGRGVVGKARALCGPTDPQKAKKEDLRSLSSDDMQKKMKMGKAVKNVIHSSANSKEAVNEINFFFRPWELVG